jgi:hypothetical protein
MHTFQAMSQVVFLILECFHQKKKTLMTFTAKPTPICSRIPQYTDPRSSMFNASSHVLTTTFAFSRNSVAHDGASVNIFSDAIQDSASFLCLETVTQFPM